MSHPDPTSRYGGEGLQGEKEALCSMIGVLKGKANTIKSLHLPYFLCLEKRSYKKEIPYLRRKTTGWIVYMIGSTPKGEKVKDTL